MECDELLFTAGIAILSLSAFTPTRGRKRGTLCEGRDRYFPARKPALADYPRKEKTGWRNRRAEEFIAIPVYIPWNAATARKKCQL